MAQSSASSKVYFVLYLAVLLELLIIIVERDEAEELFFKRQKELEEQVAALLVFMNPSAVSEPINVSQQGLIVFDEQQPDPHGYTRTYTVNVAVNNPGTATDIAEKITRGNVRDMQYYLLTYRAEGESDDVVSAEWQRIGTRNALRQLAEARRSGNDITALRDTLGKPTRWVIRGHRRLQLNEEQMRAEQNWQHPLYTLTTPFGAENLYAPQQTSAFAYAPEQSDTKEFRRRAFSVQFQPQRSDVPLDNGIGTSALHCKLLFASLSDNVVGVSADTPGDTGNGMAENDHTVNVGGMPIRLGLLRTMQAGSYEDCKRYGVPTPEEARSMTVEVFEQTIQTAQQRVEDDLRKNQQIRLVQAGISGQSLQSEPKELRAVKLYAYITKLTTPNFSRSFEQNRGVTAIDVKVLRKNSAKPTLDVYANVIAGFAGSGTNAVFEGISSTDMKKLRTVVKTLQGSVVAGAQVAFFPMNTAVASAESKGSRSTGGTQWYATMSRVPAGMYVVEVSDGINTDQTEVKIYEPNAENQRPISTWYVGSKVLSVRLNTPDGTLLPDSQFLTIAELPNQAPIAQSGKTLNVPCIPAQAVGQAKVRLVWVQPHTAQEITLKEWQSSVQKEEPFIAQQNITIAGQTRQGEPGNERVIIDLRLNVAEVRTDANCATGSPITSPVQVRALSVQAGATRGRIVTQSIVPNSAGGVSTYQMKVEFNGEQFDNRDRSKPLVLTVSSTAGGTSKTHSLPVNVR